ncbi:MAG TPA: phage minor head protein [Phycisphaerae bacterium]|nr:phage minor head protein [Phycisphaerae bacterium]
MTPELQAGAADALWQSLFWAHISAVYRISRRADNLKRRMRQTRRLSLEDATVAFAVANAPSVIPVNAIDWLKSKVIMTDAAVEEIGEKYRQVAFNIAGVENERLIELARNKLIESLETGKSQAAVVADLRGAFDGWTEGQLNTVYRTNVQGAYNAAQWQRLQDDDVREIFPAYQYVAIDDDRVRPAHLAMNEKVFAATDPIWAIWWPPNGYNCRCSVIALDLPTMQEMNIEVESAWPQTDETLGPVMPDTGFEHNPGQVWKPQA